MNERPTSNRPAAFSIGPPGDAATQVGPGRPPRVFGQADHELSEAAIDGVQIRAASSRGIRHRYDGMPRQDTYSVHYDEPTLTLLVCVADGVGSMAFSHEAAHVATTWAPFHYLRYRNWPDVISALNGHLTEYAGGRLAPAVPRVEGDEIAMATTFVGVAVTLGGETPVASIVWTDDSTVWSLMDGGWTELTRLGDEVDDEVHTGGVRGLPHPAPLFHRVLVPVEKGALFVMSDGVGWPLRGSRQVREGLASWWQLPPDLLTFAGQVNFARQTHIDDRTVVGIWLDGDDGD